MMSYGVMDSHFDVIVLGTGIHESLAAAFYARKGKKVLHLDSASSYGGEWKSYSLNDLENFEEPSSCFSSISSETFSSVNINTPEKYYLELCPKFIYTRGPFIQFLQESGLGRHLDFKCIDHLFVSLKEGQFQRVPMSKEDVFNSELDLPSRRKLMKFFKNVLETEKKDCAFSDYMKEFQLSTELQSMIVHGVAMVNCAEVPAQLGLEKIRTCLHSLGRFGDTSMILPMYGGGSELSQTFCRASAIYGGVYMLQVNLESVVFDNEKWNLKLGSLSFTSDCIISSPLFSCYFSQLHFSSHLEDVTKAMVVLVTKQPLVSDTKCILVARFDGSQWIQQYQTKIAPDSIYIIHGRGSSIEVLKKNIQAFFQNKEDILKSVYYQHTFKAISSTHQQLFFTPPPMLDLDYDADFKNFNTAFSSFIKEPFHFEPLPDPEIKSSI